MNQWAFVGAAYALGVVVPVSFGIEAWLRGRTARRRLATLERR